MTNDSKRKKTQAVFFSIVMVLSMVGGSAAIAGSAAAAVSSADLADDTIAPGDDIQVTGSVDANYGGENLYIVVSEGDNTYEDGTDVYETTSQTAAEDDSFDVTAPSDGALNLGGEDSAEIYVHQGPPGEGDELDTSAGTLTVDGTNPTVGSTTPTSGETISTTTPEIVVNMTEDQSINRSTIEVTASNGGNQLFELNETNAQGISYSESDQNLTIDIAETKLDELPNEKTITVDVTAQDDAGNALEDGEEASTSFNFYVDTSPVSVDIQDQDTSTDSGAYISSEQKFNVDITNATAAIDSASVDVTGPNGYDVTNDTSSDSYNPAGPSFSLDSTESGNIPALPDGEITVTAEATDTNGAMDSDTFTFEVDTNGPSVVDDGVTINTSEPVNTNNGDSVLVSAEFNETVDANSVSGEVHLDSDDSAEVTLGDGQDVGPDQAGEQVTQVDFDVDLTNGGDVESTFENESAEIRFTTADDEHSNTNGSLDANTSFSIDTESPTASIDGDELPGTAPHTLENVVDLSEAFSVSNADGNEFELYVQPGQSGDYVPLSTVSEEPLDDFDTTTLQEGTHNLKINVTDDAGNEGFDEVAVNVDNDEPTISYDGDDPLTGMESGTEYDVADLVSVDQNGTDTISTYGYTTDAESLTYPDDFTTDADPTVTVNSNTDYVFGVELTDETTLQTNAISTSVLESGTLGVDAETNNSDVGTINVSVTSDTQLDSLNVTAETADGHRYQYSETLSDFEETANDDGTYTYDLTYEPDRDGSFDFTLANATATTGLSIDDPGVDATGITADDSAPGMTDADVAGGSQDDTVLRVDFDEPISGLAAEDLSIGDDRASVTAVSDGDAQNDGRYLVTVDNEMQTGDEPNLVLAEDGIDEQYDADGDATNNEQPIGISTIELELSDGVNLVSIPSESGSVSISDLEDDGKLTDVEAIWTYDGDGDWSSYNTTAPENSLTALEGGEGYLVVTSAGTSFDINAENVPAALDDGDLVAPTTQTLSEGWNLIGQYQERQQSLKPALNSLNDNERRVLSLTSSDNYRDVSTLSPGEGYWVFMDSVEEYSAAQAGASDVPTVENVEATELDADDTVTTGDTVQVSADASDDVAVYSVTANPADAFDAEVNGGDVETVTMTDDNGDGTYTGTFTVGGEADALDAVDKNVDVTVADEAGQNQADSPTSDSVTVDTSTSISISDLGTLSNLDATEFDGETYTEDGTVSNIQIKVEDDDGNTPVAYTDVDSYGSGSWSYDLSGLTDDTYTATVEITDGEGNTNTASDTFELNADDTTPSIASGDDYDAASATPSEVQADTDTTVTYDFTVKDLSADGGTDTIWVELPDGLSAPDSDSVTLTSATTGDGSPIESTSVSSPEDGPNNADGESGTGDAIKVTVSEDDATSYDAQISLEVASTSYSAGTNQIDVVVEDSSDGTLSQTGLTTVDADEGSPNLAGATNTGTVSDNDGDSQDETQLTLQVDDTGTYKSGVDTDSISSDDFNVQDTTDSESLTVSSVSIADGSSDGDNSVTVNVWVDGTHSGDDVTISIASGQTVDDEVGNQLSNGDSGDSISNTA